MSWVCPRQLCGMDVDDLFAYSTNKLVKIRDSRLGILHYFMMFCIIVYIAIYQLICLGGYLKFSDAQNIVRLTLQQPTQKHKGKSCNPDSSSCEDNFAPLGTLPYCWELNRTHQKGLGTYNCSYMDGAEAAAIRANSIVMTTAVHTYRQSMNASCSPGADTCTKLWIIQEDVKTYIADPESFTLLIAQSVTASGVDVDIAKMDGFLYVDRGSTRQDELCAGPAAVDGLWYGRPTSKAPCYIRPSRVLGHDFFSIGVLLDAMGISLDDASDAKDVNETKRYAGLVVNVKITYSNFRFFLLGAQSNIRYFYGLTPIKGSTYSETRLLVTSLQDSREKQDLHGVLFQVQAGGTLATFDFTQMLLQLTTSLALVAVATTIVNILAQYVLAYSPFYKQEIYHTTADFSDLRVANVMPDEQLEVELEQRGLPRNGTRVEKILRLLHNGWTPDSAPPSPEVGAAPAHLRSARQPLVSG